MKDLKLALQAIEDMRGYGALVDDVYFQLLVTVAADYICEEQDLEQGLILLNKCTPEYFETQMVTQMADDDAFASSVVKMSYKLMQLGVVDTDIESANMLSAEA